MTISIEAAKRHGIIDAENHVHYTMGIDGRKNSARASFPWLGSLQATLDNRCCFLWDQPVFTETGIITRIERDGVIAELVVPEGFKLVKSLMSGQAVCIEQNTPLCCDPSSETYWSM